MRPFALFGVFLILIGGLSVLFALVDYSSTGGACLGGHNCPSGYAAWYEGRVLIWGIFGALLLIFGLWLVARPRRHWGPPRAEGWAGPGGRRGPRGGGWDGPGPGRGVFCSRCGARNGLRFQFCHRCGAALAAPSDGSPLAPRSP